MNKREKIKILDNDTELFNKLKDKNTAIKFMELIPYETKFNGIVERLISYKERSNGEVISLEMILSFIRPNNSFNEHGVGNIFEMRPLFRIVFYNEYYDSFNYIHRDITSEEYMDYWGWAKIEEPTEEYLVKYNNDNLLSTQEEKLHRTNLILSDMTYEEIKNILLNL